MEYNLARRLVATTALATVMLGCAAGASAAQELNVIDPDPGGTSSVANAVTPDGLIAVGKFERNAARWSEADGFTPLGSLGGTSSEARDVSADGSVIVGEANDAGGDIRPFRWTPGGGMVDLGQLNGGTGSISRALGVSHDGSVVVGYAPDGAVTNKMRAFRWTGAGGMESLGALRADGASFAYGISGDGNVIVGSTSTPTSGIWQEAFRWTRAGGMSALGKINNGDYSVARAASYDGSVIVGEAADGADASRKKAFRWTQSGGMTSLGMLNGGTESFAEDVSSDGAVVVGAARNGARGDVLQAFRWDESGGMMTVEDWLRGEGATIANEVTSRANGTNDDGSVVVGETTDNKTFIARVPTAASGNSAGLITIDDLSQSLSGTAAANSAAVTSINTTLNGAGSRPLDRRADEGKAIVWASGDYGRDDHGARDGDLGIGEIGGGYNFGPVQVNAAGGFSGARADTVLGGRTSVRSGYFKLETLSRLIGTANGGLWAAVTGVGMWGQADIHRNYLINGGLIDRSSGKSDVAGYGVRGRLQWQNLVPHVSPYAELSWARTCLGGYTETGGAFPASFGRLCDSATEGRYGFDATVPVNDRIRLIATVEGVHRFESSGSNVTGQVLGLGAFSLARTAYQQDWLRAGAGIEADIGRSTLSVMANFTTRGEGPSAWVAASWRTTF